MGLITAVRAQMPVGDSAPQTVTPDTRADLRQPAAAMAPVGETTLPDAPQPLPAKQAAVGPQMLTARDTLGSSAAATAEAARAAYIKASIAAGISPLPLPGR